MTVSEQSSAASNRSTPASEFPRIRRFLLEEPSTLPPGVGKTRGPATPGKVQQVISLDDGSPSKSGRVGQAASRRTKDTPPVKRKRVRVGSPELHPKLKVRRDLDFDTFEIIEVGLKAEVWRQFRKIRNRSTKQIYPGRVYCTQCRTVVKQTDKSTSNMRRHRCAESAKDCTPSIAPFVIAPVRMQNDHQTKLSDAVIDLIAASTIPFSVVERPEFVNLLQLGADLSFRSKKPLDIGASLQSERTHRRRAKKESQSRIANIKCHILRQPAPYQILFDAWRTPSGQEVMAVQILLWGATLKSPVAPRRASFPVLVSLKPMEDGTAESIGSAIKETCLEFGLDCTTTICVSDSCQSNIRALEDLGFPSTGCLCHILALVTDSILLPADSKSKKGNDNEDPDQSFMWRPASSLLRADPAENSESTVAGLVMGVSRLATYFKRAKLNPLLAEKKLRKLKPRGGVKWNSIHIMLETLVASWEGVEQILVSKGKARFFEGVLSRHDEITQLLSLLEPFRVATHILESLDSGSAMRGILAIEDCWKSLQKNLTAEKAMIRRAREQMKGTFRKKFISRLTPDMIFPVAMAPRARFPAVYPELLSVDNIKAQLVEWCIVAATPTEQLARNGPACEEDDDLRSSASHREREACEDEPVIVNEDSLLGQYAADLPDVPPRGNTSKSGALAFDDHLAFVRSQVEQEVERYSSLPAEHIGYDEFWKSATTRQEYRYLSAISDQCKALVLSTSCTEGLFSAARAVIGDRRQNMTCSLLESLMVLRSARCVPRAS
ncbi:hypothetical protein FOL46_009763 [Perkinsus olseni]|uniref:BED-type domain-containing protein n=1 Tax=Perkinsus olseni TaxID=32597 RepID=A0A7J6L0R2_PEROL|nr:hypothetical protein FOL46_009763 [Perkinsus olseni]